MGHSEVFIKFIMVFVSLGNFFHFIQSTSPSYPTWSTNGEKRRQAVLGILAQEVIHHQDRSSPEGSGTSIESTLHMIRTSILKELGTQSADWHTTKSSAVGKSRLAPFSLGSEKPSFKGQATVEDYGDAKKSQNPVNISIVTSKTTPNPGPTETCLFGVSPCLSSTSLNGTSLVWNDMKRTLSFVWELHVFGSASLFLLLALLGILGVIHAHTLSFPLREALTLTNSLVVISVTLRAVLFLLDPYGTRQLLSRASFTALYNVSLHLLLWAQTSLALLTLRTLTLLFFQLDVQHLWVVGALALTHCIPLVVADLYPSVISHAFPLLLQTLSLCWGIPLEIGIVMKSLSNLHFSSFSLPQWMPSRKVEMCAKRVTAVCAVLGILSSTLHMYSLLWLYGLLGNWRHFGWSWWLCQFWGRILELFWGFSLIVLGSWVSGALTRGCSKSEHSHGKDTNMIDKVLPSLRKGSFKKSQKTWEELMPNNWSKYKLSRAKMSSAMAMYDDQLGHTDPVSTTSCDSQAAVLWQKVGERECVLSLIEFDMVPPSPINLRRSIESAFHHRPMVSGGLFIAPPPSWTQTVTGTNNTDGDDILPPAYSSFGWAMDTESIHTSLNDFCCEPPWYTSDQNNMPTVTEDEQNLEPLTVYQHDMSDDEITNL